MRAGYGHAPMRWPKVPCRSIHAKPPKHVPAVPEFRPKSHFEFTYPDGATEEQIMDLYFRHCELVAEYERIAEPEIEEPMKDCMGDVCRHPFQQIDTHIAEVICTQCGLVLRKYYSEEGLRVIKSVYIRRHRWNVRINQLQCCDAPPAEWLSERVLKQFNQMASNSNRSVAASKTRIMACLRILKKQEEDVCKRRLISKSAEKWIHFKHMIDHTRPVKMCPELQRFLQDVFPGIERAFETFKYILKRSSLIHYNFCLTRAIQEFIARNNHNLDEATLKDCESFLPLLPMLKSRPKVKNNDIIWDAMRKWLDWKEQDLPQAKIYRGFK